MVIRQLNKLIFNTSCRLSNRKAISCGHPSSDYSPQSTVYSLSTRYTRYTVLSANLKLLHNEGVFMNEI